MAFEPKTWACGDTITAQELNRMEQGIVEASDKGYECVIDKDTLFDGVANVVSGGEGVYNWQFPNEVTIDADNIEVVFNGTSYNLNKQSYQGSFYYYGEIGQNGPVFTTYPFLIMVQSIMAELYVQNRGDYNIKVSSDAETVETSECFEKAVKSASTLLLKAVSKDEIYIDPTTYTRVTYDHTWQEVHDALREGMFVSILNEVGSVETTLFRVMSAVSESQNTYGYPFVLYVDSQNPDIYVAQTSDGYVCELISGNEM